MVKHRPACDRALPASAFPKPTSKNCAECASPPKRRRRPIPPDWVQQRLEAEARTGVPHAVDRVIPMASRSRPTHAVRSVLVCGLDIPENGAIIPASANSAKRWYFSDADARAEEERIMDHFRRAALER
jgi:hypothetical protein